ETLFDGVLQYEIARAWLVHGGARTTRYDDVRVNQGLLMLEHYFGNFSALVAWRPSRAFSVTAHSYELRGAYYYTDTSSVVFSFADGEEATNVGTGVVIADVRSYALIGKHDLEPGRWALRYALSYVKQGDFYNRRGLTLGVEYNF
ncbi:MAG TPA: YaiO family outer membrane beta-barrel protein, partial [Burkholderiales bacterium]|nr:YaiO family outer membrane beta-barrel protein [Burkholderiales bacterium]